jgi:hypothetical protein
MFSYKLLSNAAWQNRLLLVRDRMVLLESIVCDKNNLECCRGKCLQSVRKTVGDASLVSNIQEVKYMKWERYENRFGQKVSACNIVRQNVLQILTKDLLFNQL